MTDLSYLLVPDAEMGPFVGRGDNAAGHHHGYVPCTLILEVDGQLLAALAAPRSHRAALIANTERRAVDASGPLDSLLGIGGDQ